MLHEAQKPESKIMLTENEFKTLVGGGIVDDELTNTKIALKDIGHDRMIEIIKSAKHCNRKSHTSRVMESLTDEEKRILKESEGYAIPTRLQDAWNQDTSDYHKAIIIQESDVIAHKANCTQCGNVVKLYNDYGSSIIFGSCISCGQRYKLELKDVKKFWERQWSEK